MGKMRTRCQVCDGPIANGRCKLCGMPYRNDEVLYHLNEEREDHYRHATVKAREIMRQSQMAQRRAARPQTKPDTSRQVKPNVRRQSGPTAGQRTRTAQGTQAKTAGKTAAYTAAAYTDSKKASAPGKKKSKAGVITAVVICLLGIVPNVADFARQKYEDIQYSKTMPDNFAEEISLWENGAAEPVKDTTPEVYRLLSKADGMVKVGEWCPAGAYEAYVKRGSAELIVEYTDENGTGHCDCNILEEGNRMLVVLEEGQTIYATRTDSESRLIRLELISD